MIRDRDTYQGAAPRASSPGAGPVIAAAAIAAGGALATPARAQEQATRGLPLIRDTEIENLLRDYATPILQAAGLAQQNIKVVVLNDRSFNAFVMDGRHIFINAGALFDAKTPNEIIGVFAHETGHLADGHLMRFREKLAQAQTQSIIAMLLGIGAVVAGAAAHGGDRPRRRRRDHGAAIVDPAHAARLCAHPGRPGRPCRREVPDRNPPIGARDAGIIQAPEQRNVVRFEQYADPYLQTHPMPPERVATLERLAKRAPIGTKRTRRNCKCATI